MSNLWMQDLSVQATIMELSLEIAVCLICTVRQKIRSWAKKQLAALKETPEDLAW